MIQHLVESLGIFIAGSGLAAILAGLLYVARLIIGLIRGGGLRR